MDSVKICYKYLSQFKDIYGEDKIMPKNEKLTVFCKSSRDEGFLINLTEYELGLEVLIVQKWILHSELEKLAGCEIN